MKQMRMSIAYKFALLLGLIMILSTGILITFNLHGIYNSSLREGELSAQMHLKYYADELTLQINRTVSTLETMQHVMLQMREDGTTNREQVVEMLTRLLASDPDVLALYTLWEPGAFDQADALYVNKNAYDDETGRFIPYVVRQDGEIKLLPLENYERPGIGDFYLIPKRTRQFSVIEPYSYEVDGVSIQMTSLIQPILDEQGRYLGMVGADYSLDYVQEGMRQIRPMQGYAALITSGNRYAAHGLSADLVMQPYPLAAQLQQQPANREPLSVYTRDELMGEEVLRLYYPIEYKNIAWQLEMVVPKRSILETYYASMRRSVMITLAATFFVVLTMIVLVRRMIVENIRKVIRISSEMAVGQLDSRLDIRSQDEFGTMASFFNRMIEKRKEVEGQVHHQATHDLLTGLPNRYGYRDYVHQVQGNANGGKKAAALLFIDLDRFKMVNDTLDHQMGDQLLQQAADRIASLMPENGKLFRFGGDEFIVLLVGESEEDLAKQLADQVLVKLAIPFVLQERQFLITASIGISYDKELTVIHSERMIKEADTAMYVAKKEKNTYRLYQPSMNAVPSKESMLEKDLHRALEERQFVLHYQPKLDLHTKRVYGAEALVRWNHPVLGMVSPADFIPLAEKSGFIVPLGEWVLSTACHQLQRWQRLGLPGLNMAVNMSMLQFQHRQIVEMIKRCIDESQVDPKLIELELTESIFMNNPYSTLRTLHQIKEMGIQLSLDDFGTGYSSLSYLKQIPIDYLKLDKQFARDIETDSKEQMIVKSVIVIAHNLGLKVLTEGVETKEQLDILEQHQCDAVQGFYFSRPLPEDDFYAFCKSFNS